MDDEEIPQPGQWPVDPQQDEPQVLKERIWVDGCFDFAHHGKMADGEVGDLVF